LRNRLNEHGAKLSGGDQFDEPTDVALRAFQISVGLKAAGIVDPTTKAALYEPPGPGGESAIELDCAGAACRMYLPRHMTKGLASTSRSDPARDAVTSALATLACRRVKALLLDVACETAVNYVVDAAIDIAGVVDNAQQASKHNACLVAVLGYPQGST